MTAVGRIEAEFKKFKEEINTKLGNGVATNNTPVVNTDDSLKEEIKELQGDIAYLKKEITSLKKEVKDSTSEKEIASLKKELASLKKEVEIKSLK